VVYSLNILPQAQRAVVVYSLNILPQAQSAVVVYYLNIIPYPPPETQDYKQIPPKLKLSDTSFKHVDCLELSTMR
jgi:hypothetical protein